MMAVVFAKSFLGRTVCRLGTLVAKTEMCTVEDERVPPLLARMFGRVYAASRLCERAGPVESQLARARVIVSPAGMCLKVVSVVRP